MIAVPVLSICLERLLSKWCTDLAEGPGDNVCETLPAELYRSPSKEPAKTAKTERDVPPTALLQDAPIEAHRTQFPESVITPKTRAANGAEQRKTVPVRTAHFIFEAWPHCDSAAKLANRA